MKLNPTNIISHCTPGICLLTIAISVCFSHAQANMITLNFTGEISLISLTPALGTPATDPTETFKPGDTYTGSITMDSSVPGTTVLDDDPITGAAILELYPDAITRISVSTDNYAASTTKSQDLAYFPSGGPTEAQPDHVYEINVSEFTSETPIGVNSTLERLIFASPRFDNNYPDRTLFEELLSGQTGICTHSNCSDGLIVLLFSTPDGSLRVQGRTSSITVIPIPAAVWLFGSGMLWLKIVGRRKVKDSL